MDMRTKAYPPLPEERGLQLVVPRSGDLRFRPEMPAAFAQTLFIHADPRRRFWYSRFQLRRKFIVMSTKGDLYAKATQSIFTIADLPRQTLLSMPRVTHGDLAKVLDLVQCSRLEGQRWELVRTRWSNKMETWLPLEVVQLFAPQLLQEFYVNSINSWAFHDRVQTGNLHAFRTEVELWLFHGEFQGFYRKLREQRVGGTGAAHPQQGMEPPSTHVQVKPETTASGRTQPTPPPIHAQQQTPANQAGAVSEAAIQAFEQRRIARERQQQLERMQRSQHAYQQQQQHLQQQQQQTLHQQRLQQQLLLQQQKVQERERQAQHDIQRQKVQLELHKKQLDYQRRLQTQREQERLADQRRQEKQRQEWIHGQEKLRQRLQQQQQQQQEEERQQLQARAQRQERAHRQSPAQRPPHQQPEQQRRQTPGQPKPAAKTKTRRRTNKTTSIWTQNEDDEYSPPESQDSEESKESDESDFVGDSDASEESLERRGTRRRTRKRLLYSQVEADDDDDDDLPDLSQPPAIARRRAENQPSHEEEVIADGSVPKSKKRKRIIQPYSPTEKQSNSNEIDLIQLSDDDDESERPATKSTATTEMMPGGEDGGDGEGVVSISSEIPVEVSGEDGDAEEDTELASPMVIGEIRCACGATSVGGYRGQWLQCWKEDCGVWEHADCVGFLASGENESMANYLCTRCDPRAYLARCVKASHRILDWLFQCCDSRNAKQLMELLRENTGAGDLPSDWKNASYGNRTLTMQAARCGLVECLNYLLDERKVDVFATDAQSRNALHHAALGGSIVCCRALLKYERKLLLHQDLSGCSPFHCMLQSAKVNQLCVSYLRENRTLVGMGDLSANFPIHYACQAVNTSTVEICRMIFAAQPSMTQERSSEGLHPLMILCKAVAGAATNGEQAKSLSNAADCVKQIIATILDIDVFGDCLNQKSPNGWTPLHFAAAAGNHELVSHLCNLGLVDVHAAVEETGQTALHLAAQENHPLCVRVLLLEGLSVVAKDSGGWIPMLYTDDAACIQEFLHYKLTKQLSRLHRMLAKFQQKELVHRWQRRVALDPTCFDILNDWCLNETERMERMEGLLLTNPFMLRLDNKIAYISQYVIPTIKEAPGHAAIGEESGGSDKGCEPTTGTKKKKLMFLFSAKSGCFWKQFVGMGRNLEPEDFRLPITFAIERGGERSSSGDNREGNLKLVLIRLAAGLFQELPGLLLRGVGSESVEWQASKDKEVVETQLLDFFLLGELVAHLVLFAVPVSGILDFAPEFLRCVVCKGKYRSADDASWAAVGCSFAAGFEGVLPATLELLYADDLRVLLNGPEASLNALQIDWDTVINWSDQAAEEEEKEGIKSWMPRLLNELVKEEQQLVLLFMAGTFQFANERFFRSEGAAGRLTISSCPEVDEAVDCDSMRPEMDLKSGTLRLPPYSCYESFKKAMLRAIRHTGQAFLPA